VQFYWFCFIALFLLFTALRMRHLFGYGKVSYEVVRHSQKTKDVYVLHIKSLGKKIELHAGQYVYVQLGLLHEEHPFTVLDYDNESGEITIAYKVFGSYTKKMTKLMGADVVLIDGPYGVFTDEVSVHKRPSVFIAGGIGITPFVRHVIRDKHKKHWLFYANQTKQTAVFGDYLREVMGNKYVSILSRDSSHAVKNDERGHLNESLFAKYIDTPSEYDYYICGPAGFIHSAKQSLQTLGIAAQQVHAEEFEF
jgi:predicted ferric reductase